MKAKNVLVILNVIAVVAGISGIGFLFVGVKDLIVHDQANAALLEYIEDQRADLEASAGGDWLVSTRIPAYAITFQEVNTGFCINAIAGNDDGLLFLRIVSGPYDCVDDPESEVDAR